MKKRIGSVLLALALCLSLLPATALAEGPTPVSKLDFRFPSNQPTVETEYKITDGGTAKWEPGNGSTPNKLTLNGVTMTDDSYVVAVPANTEIILSGENKITSTNGTAIYAQNAPLKITGSGSLNVNVTAQAPASAFAYALYTNSGGAIDVNINGALTVNGNIRADEGTLSLQSGDAISVRGSMYGKQKITAIAGKSLNITNTSNTAVFASSCTEVSLAAQNGNLTVSGTGTSSACGIYGSTDNSGGTALKLHASGNVSVTGTQYSMRGTALELSGTILENSTLTAYGTESLTVPAEKKLINNGTIKLISFPGAVTVLGTLTNNGSIFNETNAPIQPEVSENGVITVKVAMDFTEKNENASGQGYEWDYSSKTLTLTDYKVTETCNDTAIILPAGANLVLSGENTLNSKNGALIDAKGTLEISGTGSLTGSAGGEAALNAQGALTITDCKLDLTNPSPWKNVICTNGNALTITGSADVSLHTASDSGWGIKTGRGGNFTLGSDAKLVITGATGILAQGASVRIAGTLDVFGCANRGANLLGVTLDMGGSSITAATGNNQGIYLNGTLTGQTNIKSFTGVFQLTSSDPSIVNCYTVKKDDTLGLYAEGSTVSFTAEQQTGKKFSGWTATGVTLDNATNAEISFTMPGNDVTLTTNYRTSSSSSSSRPSYPITTPDKTENGSVNISSTSAKRGSIVTITVTPDAGYVLDKLTVTDKDGKELSLTKKSDTEYTFVMPAGKVEITPSFVKQAEEPSRVFVDVKTGDYFYDAVQWAVGKGITNGTSAETFSPEDPCTRAQIVTFLWRAAGSPVVNYAMDLSDVAGDAYYAEAVRWALSEGITTGTSADQFSPDATCTREQAVTFLYRAAGSPAVSGESAFEDVGADAYYARAVAWAAQNGVTNGISQALFGTGSDCTRAQIVTFLYRAQQGK